MNKGTAIVGFLLCFLSGMGLMWGVDRSGSPHQQSSSMEASAEPMSGDVWSDEDAAIPVSSKDPTWGARTAPVTLVLFSDYECPFCSRVENTITQLKEKYGPDKLRVIWKDSPLPFHKNARPAALAGQTVFRIGGNKPFWKFHETAFQNQKELTPEHFEQWATAAGVDRAKFKASFDKQEFAAKIDADQAVGQKNGVSGTPASFINGVFLSGAQPTEKFTAVIDEQLSAAKAAVAAGTKPDKVYTKLTGENRAKAPPAEKKDAKPAEDDKTVWKVPVGNSPVKGSPNALVTVVIFSDYQCPFCSRVEPTLAEVEKTYGEKVRLVWKDNPLPFHPRAEPAAEVAAEARAQKGDKGFWEAHDLLFKNQKAQGDDDLIGYAKELGLDTDKVKDAIANHKYKAGMTTDQDLADDLQASGTPHFFINGRRLVGAQPIEKFKGVIDEEVKKAEGLIAKGVAAKDVYAELIKDGKSAPPPETKTTEAPGPESPWKGNEKAKVVMEVYSDFQCPFCKRVEETLKVVEEQYGSKIKIVWRHKPLPMHKDAPLASEASQEVFKQKGREAFWKYHGMLFEKQGTPDALSRANLENYAEPLGIDMGKFKKALDTNSNKAFVEAESKTADAAQISGTPAFIVGRVDKENKLTGYFISGAQPVGKFTKLIDKALAEAGDTGGGDDKADHEKGGKGKGKHKAGGKGKGKKD